MIDTSFGCGVFTFLLWVGINIADGFWIYFYVEAVVSPNPRTAVNRTSSAFDGYQAMMFVFGLPWGVINLLAFWGYWVVVSQDRARRKSWINKFILIFNVLVVLPIALMMIILPFFGGWIVTPIVQNWTWNHRCDGYPMYAILDGKSYNDAAYVKNVVYFYVNGNSNTQFTYIISNPEDDDQWYFRLREFDTDQSSIPLDAYPTLQSVGYDFVTNTLSGNCTVPSDPANFSGNTTTSSCMSGTFDPGNSLFFNITSTVPLNNTANVNATQSASTILKIQDKAWTYSDAPPALILHQVNPDSESLGHTVLRTAVAKPHDCTELKVCIAGVEGREGGQVMGEVLAPLGVMLLRQSDYAIECTTPDNSD